ncbi:hypothetical protein JOY44_10060 [Phormidium sp. CLA17]|uniref:hypothetical protein n=1 Tax=Leptolyngbya sp. Cla-17 TaxID=2803751 RepID=UPI0014929A17|nr:hypothetical protein [Leptolyngbya sp. Cla-17]MBM0741965.1 hypothetical protein [Leptolyngbya sp. Cla-17]
MKLGTVALAGLTVMGAVAATNLVLAQESQPIPVESQQIPVEPQQNDRRAAIARVNPKKPIQIRVTSRTNIPVVATVLPTAGDRPIAPGKTVIFGRLHTSYLSLPMDLQVSLQETPDFDNPIRVYLEVKTVGNEILIDVKTASTGAGNSSQTVDVDEKGAVSVY